MNLNVPNRLLLAGAALALGLTGAACSDDGDDQSKGKSEPMTEEAYIAAFSESCQATGDRVDGIAEPQGFQAIVESSNEAVGYVEEGLEELRALTPPPELADQADELIDLLAQQVDSFEQLAAAAEKEDQDAMRQAVENTSGRREAVVAAADELGIDCGFD